MDTSGQYGISSGSAIISATRTRRFIRQLINEHALTNRSVQKMKQLVTYLRDQGLRVDGVCWQGHIDDLGWEKTPGNLECLGGFVAWAHQNNLEFHITEFHAQYFDIAEKRRNVTVSPDEMKRGFAAQAESFAAVLNTLLEHRKSGVAAINYRQLIDSEAQERGGNMFNEDGSPRPAYYAIQNALENPPPG